MISDLMWGIVSANKHRTQNGELRISKWFLIVPFICTLFPLTILILEKQNTKNISDVYALICLILGFSSIAIYTFGDVFFVKGNFDNSSIYFHTPWTGTKNELWENLISVKYNSSATWYVLRFKSGAIIRLSVVVSGHGLVLEYLKTLGHKI